MNATASHADDPAWSPSGGPATAPLRLPFLTNVPFAPDASGHLPYRADLLGRHHLTLHTTTRPWRGPARRLPSHAVQAALLAPAMARAPVVLAQFESSAHPLALARTAGGPLARPGLAVLSCWLPEVLAAASPERRRWYRRIYRTVDHLFCFSSNQVAPLAELLDRPEHRIEAVPFGVDDDTFRPPTEPAAPGEAAPLTVLAAGRDRGRDWPTLFAALARTGTRCRVLCRPADLGGLTPPPGVEVVGFVDRTTYRRELQQAALVLVITHVLAYPTGQSVLLEAMACGRPCVVTAGPAMADYVRPGVDALAVPPHDPAALADVIDTALADPDGLARIGRAARRSVEERFAARHLWARVAEVVHGLASGDRR